MDLLTVTRALIQSLGLGSDINSFLILFALSMGRIAMAVSLSPFLGGRAAASPIKMGLSALLALLLMPSLRASTSLTQISALLFVGLLLKELTVGLTIGVLSQLIFYAVQTAGALVDTARGMDQPGLTTPQLQSNASVLAQFKFQFALVLFLTLNGHLIYLHGLVSSFHQIPVDGVAHFNSHVVVARLVLLSGQIFVVALQLAAPVLGTLFLVDVCFAALSKVAPRINVYSESQPVKAWVGLAVVFLSIGLVGTQLPGVLNAFLADVYRFVAGLA